MLEPLPTYRGSLLRWAQSIGPGYPKVLCKNRSMLRQKEKTGISLPVWYWWAM